MRNKTRLIALLIVIIINVIGISAYFLQGTGRQQKELTPVLPEISEIDTLDWQVYRNKEYGFEVKYPKDWGLEENPDYSSVRLYSLRFPYTFFQIVTGKNQEYLNLDEWFVKNTIIQGRPTLDHAAKPIFINGIKFYKLENELKLTAPAFKAFTANPQRQILTIIGNTETSSNVILLERILLTFRFFSK